MDAHPQSPGQLKSFWERTAECVRTAPLKRSITVDVAIVGAGIAGMMTAWQLSREGRSVDTTMGFTPLEGLMMGTRSGSVDPGILIHLLRQRGCSAEKLDQVLNRESGLYGVSGVSGDMREVLAAMAEGNPRAKLAFEIYVHRLRAGIGAMLATLGGLDALVFAAGVGENAALVRAAACESFAFLGLKLDREKNARSPADQ